MVLATMTISLLSAQGAFVRDSRMTALRLYKESFQKASRFFVTVETMRAACQAGCISETPVLIDLLAWQICRVGASVSPRNSPDYFIFSHLYVFEKVKHL